MNFSPSILADSLETLPVFRLPRPCKTRSYSHFTLFLISSLQNTTPVDGDNAVSNLGAAIFRKAMSSIHLQPSYTVMHSTQATQRRPKSRPKAHVEPLGLLAVERLLSSQAIRSIPHTELLNSSRQSPLQQYLQETAQSSSKPQLCDNGSRSRSPTRSCRL